MNFKKVFRIPKAVLGTTFGFQTELVWKFIDLFIAYLNKNLLMLLLMAR